MTTWLTVAVFVWLPAFVGGLMIRRGRDRLTIARLRQQVADLEAKERSERFLRTFHHTKGI